VSSDELIGNVIEVVADEERASGWVLIWRIRVGRRFAAEPHLNSLRYSLGAQPVILRNATLNALAWE
jgi:hypothetical protein